MTLRTILAAAAVLALLGGAAQAAEEPAKGDPKPAAAASDALPPLPADARVAQTTTVSGRTLNYTANVGSLPVRDDKGKKIAEVVFTAYTLDGPRDPNRPVTFAFNGGPGAASVYLNLGAIGPKRIQFGAQGDSPSDPVRLKDNPATWLDFTDLVFIDPVGTGFSRALVPPAEAKPHFFEMDSDIAYLSRIVYDWLLKNQRLTSPKYVVGESYGGYRGPRVTHYLQTNLGVGVNGVVLVSPALSAAFHDTDASPLHFMASLPSMAAANFERQGRLDAAHMAEVEAYVRGEFATDLLRGQADPAAVDRVVKRVSAYTGLDPVEVRRMGGRIDDRYFLRALYRDQGRIGSWYDSNVTSFDPYPWSPDQRVNDPVLDAILAPTTSAMVDFVTRVVGWKVDARYEPLSTAVNRDWEKNWWRLIDAASDLREAVAIDPKLRVLIVHGYDDLSCPYFASRLILDQMPAMGAPGRVQVKAYPGGHMFYSRPDSGAQLRRDVQAIYAGG